MLLWATEADLATWTGKPDAPENAAALLRRASQLITRATRNTVWAVGSNGLPTDPDVADALRDATCAQVETWVALGVDPIAGAGAASSATIQTRTLGSASITYATPSAAAVEARANAASVLAGGAVDVLTEAGLITSAVASW